ncbi:hypothetical protein B0H13DRAFT_1899166, partial [Mycena leptocephala]
RRKRIKIPTNGTNDSQHNPATDQLSLTSIDRLPFSRIKSKIPLPAGGPGRWRQQIERDSHGGSTMYHWPPKPDSKAEYDLVILALIAVDQEDEGRVKRLGYTLVQISINFGWFQS